MTEEAKVEIAVPLVTGTDYEHRAEITISGEHLGDEEVLIHELAHVLTRSRFGKAVEVHGQRFIEVKDAMREAFGWPATGDVW